MDGVVPDYTEPIVAVRRWKVIRYNIPKAEEITLTAAYGDRVAYGDRIDMSQTTELRLASPVKSNVWKPGEMFEAKCNGGDTNIHLKSVQTHQDYFSRGLEIHLELLVMPEAVMAEGFIFRVVNGQPTIESLAMPPADFPPHEGHACGIYAMSRFDVPSSSGNVMGLVELTGRVIPAEHGWRAQFAKIVGLLSAWGTSSISEHAIAEVYDVPVIDFDKVKLSNPKDFRRRKK